MYFSRLIVEPGTADEDEVSMPLHINTNGHKIQPQPSPVVQYQTQRSPTVQTQSQKSPVNYKPTQKSPVVHAQPKNSPTIEPPKAASQATSSRINRNAQLRSLNATSNLPPTPEVVSQPKPATPEVVKPTTTIYPPPASNSRIIITYVINHRKVYIRSGEPDASQDYIRTQLDCAEYEKTAPPMRGLPSKGDILLARFDGQFYRALVLNVISAEEITVGFIDFGNKATVSFNDTKTLSAELQSRPRHTVQVTLDGMPEKMANEVVRI